MIYRSMYADRIMAYVDTPFVKILTGVLRCGKSKILKRIMYDSYGQMSNRLLFAKWSFSPFIKISNVLYAQQRVRENDKKSVIWE